MTCPDPFERRTGRPNWWVAVAFAALVVVLVAIGSAWLSPSTTGRNAGLLACLLGHPILA